MPSAEKRQVHNETVSLLAQEEYLFTKLHNELIFTPELYGTCRHFYAVENAPTLDYKKTWRERSTMALGLLHVVDLFDNSFENSLHLCDIKRDNFGYS